MGRHQPFWCLLPAIGLKTSTFDALTCESLASQSQLRQILRLWQGSCAPQYTIVERERARERARESERERERERARTRESESESESKSERERASARGCEQERERERASEREVERSREREREQRQASAHQMQRRRRVADAHIRRSAGGECRNQNLSQLSTLTWHI